MKPATPRKYTEADCQAINCQHLHYVEEQDGTYLLCNRQGTLSAPFNCRLLDHLTEDGILL